MRKYLFTKAERKRLARWIYNGEEDDATRMTFVAVRRNLNQLTNDLNLLNHVAKKLRAEGRWRGRTRLPKEVSDLIKSIKIMRGGTRI